MSKTEEIKHPGIENPGNQCYFNSILQALASCNSIFKILINRRIYDGDMIIVIKKYNLLDIQLEDLQKRCAELLAYSGENELSEQEKIIIQQIQKLPTDTYIYLDWRNVILSLIKSHSITLKINNLVYLLQFKVNNHAFKDLFSGKQCDPHEAMLFLLDLVHRYCSVPLSEPRELAVPQLDIPGLPTDLLEMYQKQFITEYGNGYSQFAEHFHNSYLSIIKCRACGHCVYNISPMSVIDIPLPIKAKDCKLEDCLANFFHCEELEKYKCDRCSTINSCILEKKIIKPAQTLIIELKRFIQHPILGLAKNNIPVEYPSILDITPHIVDQRNKLKYELNAVIVHASMMMGFGHYYCVVRKFGTDTWIICNDEQTQITSLDFALGQRGTYLLFYTMTD